MSSNGIKEEKIQSNDQLQGVVNGNGRLAEDSWEDESRESMMNDWMMVEDNRAVEDLLYELQGEGILNEQREESACKILVDYLVKPAITQSLVLACIKAFIGKIQQPKNLAQMTTAVIDYFYTKEHHKTGVEALKCIIISLPPMDVYQHQKKESQMVLAFLEVALKRLIEEIDENNISDSLSIIAILLRHYSLAIRSFTKYKDMNIYKSWFCTGIGLGSGSYANVFLGRHSKTGKKCALKIMDWDQLTRGKPKVKEQLKNEIDVMRQSVHANIVGLYDVVKEGPNLILILEYCAGGDMDGYLSRRGGKLTEKQIVNFGKQLVSGLKFLRDKGLVHRDLKPGNLLLSTNDDSAVLKITDFTFARFLEPGNLLTTLVGTPLYMAPEIFLDRQYTEKGDLWSVGVILYQMLTGSLPYKGDSVIELVNNIQRNELSWPADLEVSLNFKNLVSGLLKKKPDFRMSWTEFFTHPCFTTPLIESGSSSTRIAPMRSRSNSSTSAMEQRRSLAQREQQASKEQLQKEQLQKEQALKEQALKEQALKEQALKEQALKEQALKEQALKEQALKEQALKEQALKEQAHKQLLQKEQELKEQTLKEQVQKEQVSNNNAAQLQYLEQIKMLESALAAEKQAHKNTRELLAKAEADRVASENRKLEVEALLSATMSEMTLLKDKATEAERSSDRYAVLLVKEQEQKQKLKVDLENQMKKLEQTRSILKANRAGQKSPQASPSSINTV